MKRAEQVLLEKYAKASEHNRTVNTYDEFFEYACKQLGIKELPDVTITGDIHFARKHRSFGYAGKGPEKTCIVVSSHGRKLADILRTLGHELVHVKQFQDKNPDGSTGSEDENEANAIAGVLLRNYGKTNSSIYEITESVELFNSTKSLILKLAKQKLQTHMLMEGSDIKSVKAIKTNDGYLTEKELEAIVHTFCVSLEELYMVGDTLELYKEENTYA